MPNIKPERTSRLSQFLSTSKGELLTVVLLGGTAYTLTVSVIGFVMNFISQTLYPFSYSFMHSPLHTFLPEITVTPSLPASFIFGAAFTVILYYFEKNIFYRRFNILLKACFASVAACAAVFVSNLFSALADAAGFGFATVFLYTAEVSELPLLFLYYFILSVPLFKLCDGLRRRVFGLP